MRQQSQSWARYQACLIAGCAIAAPTPGVAEPPVPPPSESAANTSISDEFEFPATLDATGNVIGEVIIFPESIFDLDNPEEDGFLYRLANKLHIETKPEVISQQLLFKPGDEYNKRVLDETERLLRKNKYLQEVTVEPLENENGNIDVEVHTSDTWTLHPRFSFSRAGGKNSTDVGLRDMNFLGRGIGLEALYKTTVDRDSKWFSLVDKNLGNSWYELRLLYADNSDGQTRSASFGKPFYALDSTRSNGLAYLEDERVDSYYDLGKKIGEYNYKTTTYDAFLGWSEGWNQGSVRRYIAGLGYENHQFSPLEFSPFPDSPVPQGRELLYPYFGVEWLQDDFEETRNLDKQGIVEDLYLGTRFNARLGYANQSMGSDRTAWLLDFGAQTGYGDIDAQSLFLNMALAGRIQDGSAEDFLLQADARYYSRQSPKKLFYAYLGATFGHKLDLDRTVYLGGDNGLRGYPLRYQTGDTSVLFSLEKRYFTDWYPFHLFRVGAAVFFDAGRAWGEGSATTTHRGLLRDLGVGLRFSSAKSGQGHMIHVDLAYPLDSDGSIDSLQLLVSTRSGF